MALQWPLILFTTFVCAGAGLLAVQSLYALLGKGKKAQMPAIITSVVLVAIGGIAVFFHLQHAERIFNGFGHLSSGITQELIAIVLLIIVAIIFFVQIRRNEAVAKWAAIVGLIVGLGTILICGLSYMMAARPAWNSGMQILSLFGLGLAAGAGLFAFFDGDEADNAFHFIVNIVATVLGAITTAGFVMTMKSALAKFTDVGYYFDPNHPTIAPDVAANYSPFAAGVAGYAWGAIILAIVAVILAVVGKATKKWKICGCGIAICAIVAAILLRAVFFSAGGSVYMFF